MAMKLHNDALEEAKVSSIGKVRTLMVEDDEAQISMLLTLFETANKSHAGALEFDVACARSAAEALEMARPASSEFDLVLLDMLLPDEPGYTILSTMRSILGGDTAIVMMSAMSEVALVQTCVRRGTCPYTLLQSLMHPAAAQQPCRTMSHEGL